MVMITAITSTITMRIIILIILIILIIIILTIPASIYLIPLSAVLYLCLIDSMYKEQPSSPTRPLQPTRQHTHPSTSTTMVMM